MSRFRAILAPLAAVLAVVVVVQTTDLVACADEAEAAERPGEVHTDGLSGGGHPAPAPGDSHDGGHDHDGSASADCLCHIVYAPTAVVPEVRARPAPDLAPFAAPAEIPPEVEPDGLDPVPLA